MNLRMIFTISVAILFLNRIFSQEATLQQNVLDEIRFQSDVTVAEKSSKEKEADDLFIKGIKAYEKGEYEIAVKEFFIPAKEILKTIENNPLIQPKITRIDQAIAESYYFLAEEVAAEAEKAVKAQKYDEAIKLCNEAIIIYPPKEKRFRDLIERYVKMKEAVDFRSKTIESAVDPTNQERMYKIDVLFEQGKRLHEDGQFDKARDKFEEILAINPYHMGAAQKIKEINRRMYLVAKERHKMTTTERLAETEWKYVPPLVPRTYVSPEEILKEPTLKNLETSSINKKLQEIQIDKIEFDEVSVPAAIKYLKNKSREIDPEGKGVNIIFRMSTGGVTAPTTQPVVGGEEGEEAAPSTATTPTGPVEVPTITMFVDKIPLGDAIKYICRGANLKYRIEKHAVIIATQEIPLDDLETRIYPLEQEAIQEVGGETGGTGADTTGSSGAVQEYFRNRGIQFPEGARIIFDSRISRLIVTNTPENLAKIEEIIQEISVVDPQVLIEAKFVEISQEHINSLGFEWLVRRPAGQGNPPIGEHSFTFDQNSADLMRYPRDLTTTWAGNNDVIFNITHHDSKGVTYQALIHALNATTKSEILSTPRVTTMNGQEATIRMTTEQYFPTSYSEATITETGGSSWVVPSIPEFGEPTELGVILTVTPTVDADKYTISLNMTPRVQSHVGWIDYSYNLNTNAGPIVNRLIMPIFELRTVETQVTIYDGETIVMGGAIKDETTVTDDRIPVLGDLPIVGRLFRSKTEERGKRNLLIFVSVRLVNPDGSPLREREVRGLPPFRK